MFPRVTHPSATDIRRCPFDLHVLGLPPAFALSQDQTLKFNLELVRLVTHVIDGASTPTTEMVDVSLRNVSPPMSLPQPEPRKAPEAAQGHRRLRFSFSLQLSKSGIIRCACVRRKRLSPDRGRANQPGFQRKQRAPSASAAAPVWGLYRPGPPDLSTRAVKFF